MASAQDVRDILDLPAEESSPATASQAPNLAHETTATNQRPKPRVDGISRELYALLGSNAPSLTLASEHRPGVKPSGKKYDPRTRNEQRARLTHHWEQTSFRNPARQDGLVLRHWSCRPASTGGEEPREREPEEETGTQPACFGVWISD